MLPVRSGGDEIRLIVIGIDTETVENWLVEKTHPAIEKFTAEANLHDHDHMKEPENENKRGFGLALAAESLNRRDIEPNQIVKNLDDKINLEKYHLGAERRGTVFGAEQYDDASLLQAQTSARRKKREFDSLKEKNSDPLQFNRRLEQHPQYGAMAVAPAVDPNLPIQLDLTNSDEMPYTGLFKRMHNQLDKNLAASAPDIDPYNQNILHSALDRAMPIDHSAGVFGTRYLEATTAMYMHDAAEQQGGRAHLGHFEFSHLAAFNNFSHNHGDAVLGHIGTIIKQEMMNAGMVMDEVSALEREEYNVFHRGGARFNMCMPDKVRQKDAMGNDIVVEVDDEVITALGENIKKRVDQEINNQPMVAYFAERGLAINVDPDMKISELPHPKRPDEKGIDFLLTSCMLDPTLPAARQIAELNETAEVRVNKLREARKPGQPHHHRAMLRQFPGPHAPEPHPPPHDPACH